ncbi:MAG: glycine oxidase ThiO [Steroidobacteraceae bacterium]
MQATIIGAGVAGLACAVELAERGASVEVLERAASLERAGCSWFAGGMLAPWCERVSSPAHICALGDEGFAWWAERYPAMVRRGTLVLAHARDTAELKQFARRTEHYQWLDAAGIAALEPDLEDRFEQGLFFPEEAYIDPRSALAALAERLTGLGGTIRFSTESPPAQVEAGRCVIDCTGLGARAVLTDLRGVKGEMLHVQAPDVALTRTIRVLHPRTPVYIVPRGEGRYMIGATMIESDQASRISVRAMLELLGAAYALHPAFGEAEIVEIGTGVRPAFPDNLPRLTRRNGTLYVNGLFRHGFLAAPALARRAAEFVLEGREAPEVMQ